MNYAPIIKKALIYINLSTLIITLSISVIIGYLGGGELVIIEIIKYWSYLRNIGFCVLFLILILSLVYSIFSKVKENRKEGAKVSGKTIIGIAFLVFSFPLGATLGTALNLILNVLFSGEYIKAVFMIFIIFIYVAIPLLIYRFYKYIRSRK